MMTARRHALLDAGRALPAPQPVIDRLSDRFRAILAGRARRCAPAGGVHGPRRGVVARWSGVRPD